MFNFVLGHRHFWHNLLYLRIVVMCVPVFFVLNFPLRKQIRFRSDKLTPMVLVNRDMVLGILPANFIT